MREGKTEIMLIPQMITLQSSLITRIMVGLELSSRPGSWVHYSQAVNDVVDDHVGPEMLTPEMQEHTNRDR